MPELCDISLYTVQVFHVNISKNNCPCEGWFVLTVTHIMADKIYFRVNPIQISLND